MSNKVSQFLTMGMMMVQSMPPIPDYIPSKGRAGTYIRESEKIGRNEPCPCGSKKKYKKCCIA